jgi:glycosyltransferase involved in cell wall biosynthesis
MITGRDIVCVSFGAWDDMVETPQYLMTRLAKHNRVLFVDMPVSPIEFVRGMRSPSAIGGKLRQWRRGYREVAPNLYVAAPPPILPKRTNRYVNRLNAIVLKRWLANQAKSLGFQRPIYWNFQPRLPTIGRGLNPAVSVYYCVDDFAAAPYAWNNEVGVRALEAITCRESDLVICTGRNLVEKRKHLNPNTQFVPEAADIELFARATLPETVAPPEIARLPGKIIGYTGLINWRVDVELMVYLATSHPEWSFPLIGPLVEDGDMSSLTSLPNVHLFGRKSIDELPAYLKAIDVCLLPYVLNDYTHHIFPLKLYEYMAAGKPIVSSDMFEMRAYEGEDLAIGRTYEEFEQRIIDALAAQTPESAAARSARAFDHTWEHRIEEVSALLEPLLPGAGDAVARKTADAMSTEAAG